MIIDLSKVDEKGIIIDKEFSFTEDYIKNTPIQKLDNIKVIGRIYYDVTEEIVIDLKVNGSMILLDAIDLTEIDYPIDLQIHEVVDEKSSEYDINSSNTLDIMSFLWQNIVLEVPIRVIKEENKNKKLNGDGWELIDEDTKKVDSRLEPLKALLEKEGKE